MRIIIAGSRTITDYNLVKKIIENNLLKVNECEEPFSFILGGARGVDKLAERWAIANNIGYSVLEAQWDLYGKKAGYLRNVTMAKDADALIAIWDGWSKGTKHMINIAKEKGLKVYVFKVS